VVIGDLGFGKVWQARIPEDEDDGESVVTRYTLRELLDQLAVIFPGLEGPRGERQGIMAERLPEVREMLIAFGGWMAKRESDRRSERIKVGLAARKAEGRPVGRQPGAADKKPRKRSRYVARSERERATAS
jgi:DNA invertase Pin-like site-specific DNA recombinase